MFNELLELGPTTAPPLMPALKPATVMMQASAVTTNLLVALLEQANLFATQEAATVMATVMMQASTVTTNLLVMLLEQAHLFATQETATVMATVMMQA